MKLVGKVSRIELENADFVRLEWPPFDILVSLIDGQPHAIEDACNHSGASLAEGSRDGRCVICPMHGYRFDLASGALVRPRGLCGDQRRYVAVVEGEDVVIFDPFEITIEGAKT